jgi:hypothetical protein
MNYLNLSEPLKYKLVDELLDCYNHYLKLYQALGDPRYKERADKFMNTLKYHFSSQV